jgi:hypothetical protein
MAANRKYELYGISSAISKIGERKREGGGEIEIRLS